MTRDAGGLPEKMLAIHEHLWTAGIDHAFGGALALAWCTRQARDTIDLDLNVFVGPERADVALAGLPSAIVATAADRALLVGEGRAIYGPDAFFALERAVTQPPTPDFYPWNDPPSSFLIVYPLALLP